MPPPGPARWGCERRRDVLDIPLSRRPRLRSAKPPASNAAPILITTKGGFSAALFSCSFRLWQRAEHWRLSSTAKTRVFCPRHEKPADIARRARWPALTILWRTRPRSPSPPRAAATPNIRLMSGSASTEQLDHGAGGRAAEPAMPGEGRKIAELSDRDRPDKISR
jgi:hypothetical protein